MLHDIPINRMNNTDLVMYLCGTEDCEPGHSYGPAVRDHFLIHYVLEGKGFFQVDSKIYHVEKGQGFLICPDKITFYQADDNDPWKYSWFGFHGLKAKSYLRLAGLTEETPIFSCYDDDFIFNCIEQMIETKKIQKSREIRLLGLLHMFLSQLIETRDMTDINNSLDKNENRKELYVKKAILYIAMNYSRKITISEMSSHVGLNRSYLCSIFKEVLNTSPQKYLINFMINKSCELLKNSALSIGDISRSIGYDDPFHFSKLFKKEKGLSPSQYRKKISR